MGKIRRNKKDNLIPFEKSKRVILLERRGAEDTKVTPGVVGFALAAAACFLYCLSIYLFMGYGTYFFLLWAVMAVLFLGISVFLYHRNWVEAVPSWLRTLAGGCAAVGVILFLVVEGLILSQFGAEAAPRADYMIVLGAQWKSHGPSYVLECRLEAAEKYLKENPGTMVIVSGGQGVNEPKAEAQGMAEYLIAHGIGEERIFIEKKSTNTEENLRFSEEFLDKEQDRVVLVTNNFHMYRAEKIAQKVGYRRMEGLSARSYPAMLPNNLLREFLAVVKDWAKGNL